MPKITKPKVENEIVGTFTHNVCIYDLLKPTGEKWKGLVRPFRSSEHLGLFGLAVKDEADFQRLLDVLGIE